MSEIDRDFLTALERGVELFNKREFFEAHEVWEEKWSDSEGDARHLLQGLIQVAAAFHKLQVGMPSGTYKLLEKGAGHLRQVPESGRCNLAIEPLLASMDLWREVAKRMLDEFRTDYDKQKLPTLEFVTSTH